MVPSKRPVAVVTGAVRSLGRAISETLHGQGYAVALCDIDDTEAAKAAASLDPAGTLAKAYKLDVSNAAEVTAVMDAVTGDLGVPTALVNNAGSIPIMPCWRCPKPLGTGCSTSIARVPFSAARPSGASV